MADTPIHTLARITGPLGAVHVAGLKNGKSVIVHRSKALEDAGAAIATGDTVLLELTPYDFDSGRIVAIHPARAGEDP